MKAKGMFEQHSPKLLWEAILKSTLCGLSVGFIAGFIAAVVTWFTPAKDLWIPLVIFGAVSIAASFVIYFAKYRLSDMKNAKRLDSLGLHERLMTMVEYQDDQSAIARMQRADARAALATIDPKTIKILIPRAIAVTVLVCAFLSSGMVTVNALSDNGILKGGDEIVEEIINDATVEYVTVSYVIEDGGIIEGGDEDQIIVKGTDAQTVTAVADEGYVFKEWSDGYGYPTRTDVGVTEDLIVEAIFTELEEGDGDGDGDGDGEGDGEGDEPQDQPAEQNPEDGGTPPEEGDPNQAPQGGGASDPDNKIINNDEYYRDVIDRYEEETTERLESSEGLSSDEREMIEKYLGIV